MMVFSPLLRRWSAPGCDWPAAGEVWAAHDAARKAAMKAARPRVKALVESRMVPPISIAFKPIKTPAGLSQLEVNRLVQGPAARPTCRNHLNRGQAFTVA